MLQFVLSNVPNEWEDVQQYITSYMLFTLSKYKGEYQKVQTYFYGERIKEIQRVQNPFQYGRYMLRREMLQTNYEVSKNIYKYKTSYTQFLYLVST